MRKIFTRIVMCIVVVATFFTITSNDLYAYSQDYVTSFVCDSTGIDTITISGWPTSTVSGASALVRNSSTLQTVYASTNYVTGTSGTYDTTNWTSGGYFMTWATYDSIFPNGFYLLRFDSNGGTLQEYVYVNLPTHNCEDYFDLSSTRIVSVTNPINEQNLSTTTFTFSGVFQIASTTADNNLNNLKLRLNIQDQGLISTTTVNNQGYIDFSVTSFDTLLSYSTSSSKVLSDMANPFVFNNDSRYVYFFTLHRGDFQYGEVPLPNNLDFIQFTIGNFDPTGGLNYDLSNCNLFSGFDMQDCLQNLLLPNDISLATNMKIAKDTYARAWPIGYVSRLIEIVAGTSTVVLPSVVVPLFGNELDLTPWDKLFGTGSILDTASSSLVNPATGQIVGDGDSLRDVFETYWVMLWYILLGFAIVHDIVGFGKHNMHKKI